MNTCTQFLLSCNLISNDKNNDSLCVWVFSVLGNTQNEIKENIKLFHSWESLFLPTPIKFVQKIYKKHQQVKYIIQNVYIMFFLIINFVEKLIYGLLCTF